MVEYKVINWSMGLVGNSEKLEKTLNEHALAGWRAVHIAEQSRRIVFERNKNR